jgi:Bacterial membrane protein YfhO
VKKISFSDVAPHLLAVLIFLIVTVMFFSPIFFDKKALNQHDIQMFLGSSKALRDYREATGEEGLWANAMFSGMPAYLINMDWSDGAVSQIKRVGGLFLPHPVLNIFWAFISYYILLLAFRVRPYLAIGGALAFGLSSFVIIGLGAGHNGRIGAIAFMPLVMAGIHLAFSGNRKLGFGVTTVGLALHLRENHLQMTYYLLFIVLLYGLVQMIVAFQDKKIKEFGITLGMLVPAAVLAAGTFFGQFWAINEYQKYTIRGKADLVNPASQDAPKDGLGKTYAFDYSNGISEPLTLLPNIVGGASANFLVQNEESKTYQALMQSGDNQTANQLAQYSSAYWGEQRISAPYYAGAIIVFLFVVGILFADKKWVWWLASLAVLSIMMSWGKSFPAFNYFLFDYLPGYNKFRSVTFTLIIILFSMPLLGMLGLEKLMAVQWDKAAKMKLWIALGVPGIICLFFWATGGTGSFMREAEKDLPMWFLNALKADRQTLLRDDAFRSLAFIVSIFVVLYFQMWKKVSPIFFYAFLGIMVLADVVVVDRRHFTKESFVRKAEVGFDANESDIEILKDKSYYRVYNLQDIQNPFGEARTSYFHNSLSGYHGAKMRRYQDLYDSSLHSETIEAINKLRSGNRDFSDLGVINMLNTKYFLFGAERNAYLPNPFANGNAWFVSTVEKVKDANEEINRTGKINTRTTAVTSDAGFSGNANADSASTISLADRKPYWLKYDANSASGGLAVFSEIYYPDGWSATIDGKAAPILRANYLLRALEIPAGRHVVEFTFAPNAYMIGDKVTMASSWLVLLVLLGTIGLAVKEEKK